MAKFIHAATVTPMLPQVVVTTGQRLPFWITAASLPAVIAILAWALQNRLPVSAGTVTAYLSLLLLLAACAVSDLRWLVIPNWATYSGFIWAILISSAATIAARGTGTLTGEQLLPFGAVILPVPLSRCLAGALVCFLIMLVVYVTSQSGAGDVKLATAIGAFVGVKAGILIICYAFVLAGVTSLAIVIWIWGPWFFVKAVWLCVGHFFLPHHVRAPTIEETDVLKRPLPLGVFFAAGTLMAVLDLPGIDL